MIKSLFFLLFVPFCVVHAQDTRPLRERDFKQWQDSVAQVRSEKRHREALVRLSAYEANQKIDTLEAIDLSDSRLDYLPDFVAEAANLKHLDFSIVFMKHS